jgi:hypothetical protein
VNCSGEEEGEFCAKIIFVAGSVLDKSKARFGRLQNSPSAQTLAIAYPALRQDFLAKTLSTAAQIDVLAQNTIWSQMRRAK